MKKIIPALVFTSVAALALSACSDPEATTAQSTATNGNGAFDVSTIEAVPEIQALVPQAIKDKGVLANALSADYAPAEFLADDGQTPVGYDVDIVNAIAAVMGLESKSEHNEFDTILPALGNKYDVGASSFTINPDRLQQVNMISYLNVGSAYAVAKDNPAKFNPEDPCGATIGVQTGTYQEEFLTGLSEACVKDGKAAIDLKPHALQSEIAPKVIGGQYAATLADSPIIGYTIKQADGKLEQAGDVLEAEPQGIAVALDNPELAGAVQKALQHLMDNGTLEKILANYGAEGSALKKAELNPGK